MSGRLLTEADLKRLDSNSSIGPANVKRLLADHRRMREAIASADGGQYCPFCQQDSLEHADNCIYMEVSK